MRLSRFAIGTIFLLVLIISTVATAQTGDTNLIGIFADAAATVTDMTADAGQEIQVYVVILDPVNPDFGGVARDVVSFGNISFDVHRSANLISTGLASGSFHLGGEIAPAIKALSSPGTKLTGRTLVAGLLRYMVLDDQPAFLRIAPIPPQTNIIYTDLDDTDGDPNVECQPASGSWEIAGFTINGAVVATDERSFGSIKAMFR